MSKITKILSRQILDSRGNPTVEVDVFTANGNCGRAAVPSGASTGTREAIELRDNDPKYYRGKSVKKALNNIDKVLAPALLGKEVCEQRNIDQIMLDLDGTPFKSKLGANAILGISMAACRAGALDSHLPLYSYLFKELKVPTPQGKMRLPAPLMNILNGGQHASNNLDIQEFMIIPHLPMSFRENLRAGVEIFHVLKSVLQKKGYSTNVGDEGGFAPNLSSHEEAIELIMESIQLAGFRPGRDIFLALDVASSEFFEESGGHYQMQGKKYTSEQMIEYYKGLLQKYPLYSIEDGLAESDSEGWIKLTKDIGNKVLIVGDDLFVTNKKILANGIERKMANSILVKVNQIGTLSETFDTLELAYKNNFKAIISHRSGETGDTFIADLSVACGAGFIKTGSSCRSDRVEKYNQLLRIEEELGDKISFDPPK